MASMGAHDQSSKYLQVSIPDYNFSSETHVTSLHSENTSLSSKMKRMLASPKVSRGKAAPNPNKTFGVPLEHLTDRDKAEVPVIVSRICEFLRAQGFKQEGLFRVNGNMKVVDRLKNSFDKCGDANLEEIGDVPAAASLLKMFLREMADPVIPEDLQPIFIQVQDQFCKQKDKAVPLIKELIRRMPKDNAYLLKYLCEFMLAIADGSDVNKMTPLALAIVFGPNIFRCGEGLDGLRDQAYVNAVLLLILQEYEEMFLIDNNKFPDSKPRVAPEKPTAYFDAKKAKTEETNKTAPARPPPPRLGLEQEIPVPFEKSPKRSSTKSPRRSSRRKSPKSPRQEPPIKQRSASKKKSKKEAERSASPTFSHLSSPLSKQLLVSTISTTVKEHLFGPDMLISSTESESHDDRIPERSAENSQNIENEDAEQNSVYPSVKERVKKFSVSSEPGNTPSKNLKSNKPNDQRKPSFSRSFSSLSADMKNEISDTDLDFIKVSSQNTLEHLTTKRAQPPSNRRRPTSYVRCEDDNTRQSKGQPSRPSATRNNNSNADCETIYSDKVVPRTHEARDSSSHSRSNRRTMNQRDADAAINSFEKLNILQMQDEDRGTESYKVSRSFVKNSNDNEEKLAFNSGPPSPSENRKQMWKEKRQDNVLIVEMTPQELKKRITALKMTISNFEADFMAAHGRKPKPSEKTQIQKYIAELGRAKKQHKELMNDYKDQPELLMDTEPMGLDLGTAPNFREIMHRDAEPTKEQTLSNLLKRLEEKRSATGRPHEILAMSPEQLTDEKLAVQKSLLQYENQHGRPSSKEDKTLMRPIYDRYRKIKRLIAAYKMDDTGYENENETIYDTPRSGRTYDASFESSRDETLGSNRHISKTTTPRDLISSPTAEYYTIVTVDDGNPEDYLGSGTGGEDSTLLSDTFSVTNRLPYTPEAFSPQPESSNNGFEESVLHEASLNELLDQLKDTKNAKKRLGKILKDFEDNFFATNDRKVQKEDRLPREAEYREYKLIKAKLRLVEALIAKKKRSTESM